MKKLIGLLRAEWHGLWQEPGHMIVTAYNQQGQATSIGCLECRSTFWRLGK
jgi:hypothetical protein